MCLRVSRLGRHLVNFRSAMHHHPSTFAFPLSPVPPSHTKLFSVCHRLYPPLLPVTPRSSAPQSVLFGLHSRLLAYRTLAIGATPQLRACRHCCREIETMIMRMLDEEHRRDAKKRLWPH